jgi:hypothetical protein
MNTLDQIPNDPGRFRIWIHPPDDPITGKPRETIKYAKRGHRRRIHREAVRHAVHLFGEQPTGHGLPNATVVVEKLQADQQIGGRIPDAPSRIILPSG